MSEVYKIVFFLKMYFKNQFLPDFRVSDNSNSILPFAQAKKKQTGVIPDSSLCSISYIQPTGKSSFAVVCKIYPAQTTSHHLLHYLLPGLLQNPPKFLLPFLPKSLQKVSLFFFFFPCPSRWLPA